MTAPDSLGVELAFRPPYDWPSMLRFLGPRAIPGVEEVTANAYRRTISLPESKSPGWIEVTPHKRKSALRVAISASLAKSISAVLARVKHFFDLSCRPSEIAEALGDLASAHPGLRLPGAFDGFETAVRAIIGQQVSVRGASTLAGRFAAAFGVPVGSPFAALSLAFPSAGRIASVDPADVAKIGLPKARARTISELARAVSHEGLRLVPGGARGDAGETIAKLKAIPGIGEWTAQYIAMRALAWPDAFPHSDLGLMKALGEKSPKQMLARGKAWRPWRSYAVMHLWMKR